MGKPPFETKSLKDTYSLIKRNEYYIPSRINDSARQLIKRLLRLNPDERPTAGQILGDPFFSGYIPVSLPTSCLSVAPHFKRAHLGARPPDTGGWGSQGHTAGSIVVFHWLSCGFVPVCRSPSSSTDGRESGSHGGGPAPSEGSRDGSRCPSIPGGRRHSCRLALGHTAQTAHCLPGLKANREAT